MEEDRRLLAALARREKIAWAEVYDRYVRDVYGFVYHLAGGDLALAEDVHQEVWLAALEGIDRYDTRSGRFRDWLMGIARHRVSRHFRGLARVSYATVRGWGTGPDLAGLPPPEQLEELERAEVVRAAMICMVPDQRDVLVAKYIDGRSMAEIADRMGKTAKAVESLLTRARERLRGLLRHYFSHMEQGVRHEPSDRRPPRG
jgi:RNA polymerase sigma-70 factor (ECF subfamily)